MKRRKFLGLFGAAATAPLLPAVSMASGTNPAIYGMALNHARTRPHVTARGLAYCLKVSKAEAAQLMERLAAKGAINPINAAADGSLRATSNILIKDPWGLARVRQPARASVQEPKQPQDHTNRAARLTGDTWLTYLQSMCRARGMSVAPCGAAT